MAATKVRFWTVGVAIRLAIEGRRALERLREAIVMVGLEEWRDEEVGNGVRCDFVAFATKSKNQKSADVGSELGDARTIWIWLELQVGPGLIAA